MWKAAMPIMVCLLMLRKFAREQLAQHVGDGDAALECDDLDASASAGVMSIVRRAAEARRIGDPRRSVSDALIQASGLVGRDAKPRCSDRSLMARSFRSR